MSNSGDLDSLIEQKIEEHAKKHKQIDVEDYIQIQTVNLQISVVRFVLVVAGVLVFVSLGVMLGWWELAKERYENILFAATFGFFATGGVLFAVLKYTFSK